MVASRPAASETRWTTRSLGTRNEENGAWYGPGTTRTRHGLPHGKEIDPGPAKFLDHSGSPPQTRVLVISESVSHGQIPSGWEFLKDKRLYTHTAKLWRERGY
jgi:hypothetical protein